MNNALITTTTIIMGVSSQSMSSFPPIISPDVTLLIGIITHRLIDFSQFPSG